MNSRIYAKKDLTNILFVLQFKKSLNALLVVPEKPKYGTQKDRWIV